MNQAPVRGDLDYLTHLAQDSARFAEVLGQTPPQMRVPTCPDWEADDLLWHLCRVQWFWGTIVGRALTTDTDVEALDKGRRPSHHDGLLALFGQASHDLLHNLSSAPRTRPHGPGPTNRAWDSSVAARPTRPSSTGSTPSSRPAIAPRWSLT